ncbi:hypothetical protein BSKO_09205 [Bryopsis sp. KO-2023]|nr:hypothetical protein BSKO_09205 [Bryopsis sp. KO-2023]
MKDERAPGSEQLSDLLSQCFKSPTSVPLQGSLRRSGILALCLHCMMVKAGFRTAANAPPARSLLSKINPFSRPLSVFTPPQSWLCLLPSSEFIFRYTYPGKEGVFILHCSIQESTERMFVQVSEDGNRKNIQVMGIQVDRNVPDSPEYKKACRTGKWTGVMKNQTAVADMFRIYVTEPLLRNADASEQESTPTVQEDNFAPKLIGLGLAVVIVLVISRRC